MSPVTRNVMLHEFTVMVKANADALISRRCRKVPHPPPKDGVGLSLLEGEAQTLLAIGGAAKMHPCSLI